MWENLALNFVQISLIVFVWQVYADRQGAMESVRGKLIAGIVLGTAGCISMSVATPVLPGFIFDLRASTVACAAFFGGPVAAAPAVVLTLMFRGLIGGQGMPAGMLSIVAVAFAALALRAMFNGRGRGPRRLLALSAGVAIANLLGYLAVPPDQVVEVVRLSALPATSFILLTTWTLALLLQRENNRRDLIRTNAIYRQMVEALPDCLNAKDLEGRFIAANPATAALMNAGSADNLIGRTDADFYAPAEARAFAEVEREVANTGELRTVEQEILLDGQHTSWVATQKIPIRGDDGAILGVITHNRDITHQRELLRMKSEFISTVSHELRTPLTSVRGSLVLMGPMLGADAAPTLRNLLEIATRNSERLVRLINDILDVEKIESGNLHFTSRPCNLSRLIREAIPSLSSFMPEQKVTIRFDDRAPDAEVDLDPTRFEQVLTNLVSNAIKFSPAGGTVVIRSERAEGKAIVSVADSGRGIPASFREKVFSRFQQADGSDARPIGGTGLGLHIAKVMSERMGGDVRFASEEGRGTTFFIEFPDHTPAESAPTRVNPLALVPASTGSGAARVLHVEDDDSLAAMVGEMLRERGMTDHVGTLAEGRSAIAARRYDLVIIDDVLPDGSGLRLLQDLPPDVPAITFTAKDIRRPMPSNVRHRFVKTRVVEAEVAAAIDRLLAEGSDPRPMAG